jgi:hypothetical protein
VKIAFEERLIMIARAELPDATFSAHADGSPCFTFRGETWTTGWPLADDMGWKFFRLSDGNLAQSLVEAATARPLPLGKVTFSYSAYRGDGQLSDVKQHIGRSGWLKVARLSVKTGTKRTIDHLLLSATADDGTEIPEETLDRLFLVPATVTTDVDSTPLEAELSAKETAIRKLRLDQAEQVNADHLAKETDKLDAYAEDLELAADAEIKALDDEIKVRRKEIRSTAGLSVAEKVEKQRAIKRLEGQRDDRMMAKFETKKAIRKEVEDLLDAIQASLKLEPQLTPVFTIRWELRE